MDLLCISLLAGIFYIYILYPIAIDVLARTFPKEWIRDDNFFPTISILVPAYNEEAVIERCLHSLRQLDYPQDIVEIVIGSDGSSDRTNEIIRRFEGEFHNVRALCFPQRRGKMLVVNDLADAARGEILFFTDADVVLTSNSLKVHMKHFADPVVGAVAGAYQVVSKRPTGVFDSEKQLVTVETRLRKNESLLHSTIGMFGGNYSIRKKLWKPMPNAFVYDDVYVVLSLITRGFRVIFEPESIGIDEHTRSLQTEFRRKSRGASFGFSTVRHFPELVGFRKGLVSVMLWSHKILRWLSPWALLTLGAVIASAYFSQNWILWQTLFYAECLIVAISSIGYMAYLKKIDIMGFQHIFWFLSMQAAFMVGTLRFIAGSEAQAWVQPPRALSSAPSDSCQDAVI